MRRPLLRISLLVGMCLLLIGMRSHAVSEISIEAAEVSSDAWSAKNIQASYRPDAAFKLTGQAKTKQGSVWNNINLECPQLLLKTAGVGCPQGLLKNERTNVPFSLHVQHQAQSLQVDLHLQDAKFSDDTGLHAGEHFSANMQLSATRSGQEWLWQSTFDWLQGVVFWQPFYVSSGGHHMQANGRYSPQKLLIQQADVQLKDAGQASFSGTYLLGEQRFETLELKNSQLDFGVLYPNFLKPLLGQTLLSNMEVAGKATLAFMMDQGELKEFKLKLNQLDMEDKNHRFAFYKVNADIPWAYDEAHPIALQFAGGNLLKVPLKASSFNADINRYALTAPQLKLNVMDGAFVLSDVSAARIAGKWSWHLHANLENISMPAFTKAVGWPRMEGNVSAKIPLVTYSDGDLSTDGSLLFNVFDGEVEVTHLNMQSPLGVAPKLNADLQFRRIDLGDLSRTYSFGAIEGKLDGEVKNLQLANWQPVQFDAKFESSPGSYKKKISQRAVENISALGGAGAVAALQRSFLRFLKAFNYEKLGLSCTLRNGVCNMQGVESTSQGYVIVKGTGVPAITVMGYNQQVDWAEFLARVQRVTAGDATPIIK